MLRLRSLAVADAVANMRAASSRTAIKVTRRRAGGPRGFVRPEITEDRHRELALLRAEKLVLSRMVEEARAALKAAQDSERKVLLLAEQPWRLATRSTAALHFTSASLKAAANHVAANLPDVASRSVALARLKKVPPGDWAAAAKVNVVVRKHFTAALSVNSRAAPDPLFVEKAKAMVHFTAEELGSDPAAVEKLRSFVAQGATKKASGGAKAAATAAAMKRDWFAMTGAIATHGSAEDVATKELLAMADRITGWKR
jgi:hypothetical protein